MIMQTLYPGVRVMYQHEVLIDDSLKMAVSRWKVLKIKN